MSVLRVPSWVTMGVLTFCGMVVSLQQTLVIPLLPDLPKIFDVSADDASWLVTATLLTAAVATPIVSRMADMYGKRRMLLVSLAVMTVGSLIAAIGGTFLFMLVGRAMQGFGASLIPVGMGIMRDQLPREKLAGGIALMSATLGIGGALGLPLSGVLYSAFGWTSLFWTTALVGTFFLVAIPLTLNESTERFPGRFDIVGALLFTVVLVSLLLPLSKGATWGWSSGQVIGLTVLSLVCLAIWIPLQLRVREPMVNLRTAVRRPILFTNVSSYFVGVGMFLNVLVTTQELQVPTTTGYGLGLPVAVAGLAMVPGGLMMLAFSPFSARMLNRWGGKTVLLIGGAIMALTYLWRMLNSTALWEVVLGNMLVSVGSAIAFAAMPALVMASSPRSETASANGINALVRSMGTSSGSAVVALIFASLTVTVNGVVLPSAQAMFTAHLLGAAVCVVSVLFALLVPARGRDEEEGIVPEPAPTTRATQDQEKMKP